MPQLLVTALRLRRIQSTFHLVQVLADITHALSHGCLLRLRILKYGSSPTQTSSARSGAPRELLIHDAATLKRHLSFPIVGHSH